MKTFIYKNCFEKIPEWPFWGLVISEIQAPDILEADAQFKLRHPEFVVKNNLATGITVSVPE